MEDLKEEDASAENSVMRELKQKLEQRNMRREHAQGTGAACGTSAPSGAFTLDSFTLDGNGVTSALLGIKEKLSYWVNSLQSLMMDSDDDENDHSSSDEYIVVSPTADGPTPNRQARRNNNNTNNAGKGSKEKADTHADACARAPPRPSVPSTGSLATLLKSPAPLAGKSRSRNLGISDTHTGSRNEEGNSSSSSSSSKPSSCAGSGVPSASAALTQKRSLGAGAKPVCAMTYQRIQPSSSSSSSSSVNNVPPTSKSTEPAATCTGHAAALEGGISAQVNASRTHALTADGRVYKISVSKDEEEGEEQCTNSRVLEPRKADGMSIKVRVMYEHICMLI